MRKSVTDCVASFNRHFNSVLETNSSNTLHYQYHGYESLDSWHQWRTQEFSEGGSKGPCLPKFLENIVILCFERRFSKQNSVIRLKLNIWYTLPNTDSTHCRILFIHFFIFQV